MTLALENPRRREMAHTRARARRVELLGVPSFIVLDDVSWDLYEDLLKETEHQPVRITYDQGRLVLMAPTSPVHEVPKGLLGRFVETCAEELNVPIKSVGSATWKRKDLGMGLESDECYFIQHEAQVRNKKTWNLRRDPPPDLAIEIEITNHPANRAQIYEALGVGELWRCDGRRVSFFKLGADGRYSPISSSQAMPSITSNAINHFLAMVGKTDDTTITRAFREWVGKHGNP